MKLSRSDKNLIFGATGFIFCLTLLAASLSAPSQSVSTEPRPVDQVNSEVATQEPTEEATSASIPAPTPVEQPAVKVEKPVVTGAEVEKKAEPVAAKPVLAESVQPKPLIVKPESEPESDFDKMSFGKKVKLAAMVNPETRDLVPYLNNEAEIEGIARAGCKAFDDGLTYEQVVMGLVTVAENERQLKGGGFIVGAGVAELCPEHNSKIK